MSYKKISAVFDAVSITESGLTRLGNLIEEYQIAKNLSENKLVQLNILLLTYYFETHNLIHNEIFDEINSNFEKHEEREKFIPKNIKFLHENGFLKLTSTYSKIKGARK